jgi:hypothetical protein
MSSSEGKRKKVITGHSMALQRRRCSISTHLPQQTFAIVSIGGRIRAGVRVKQSQS